MKNICGPGLMLRLKRRFGSGEPEAELSAGNLT